MILSDEQCVDFHEGVLLCNFHAKLFLFQLPHMKTTFLSFLLTSNLQWQQISRGQMFDTQRIISLFFLYD